jgi:hypothetical protein
MWMRSVEVFVHYLCSISLSWRAEHSNVCHCHWVGRRGRVPRRPRASPNHYNLHHEIITMLDETPSMCCQRPACRSGPHKATSWPGLSTTCFFQNKHSGLPVWGVTSGVNVVFFQVGPRTPGGACLHTRGQSQNSALGWVPTAPNLSGRKKSHPPDLPRRVATTLAY